MYRSISLAVSGAHRTQGVGTFLQHMQVFLLARAAGTEIFDVIDRDSAIDALSPQGACACVCVC